MKNNTITISIIVPVYNAANYIDDCIHSLIKQNYPNIEIILVDDGSADNSLEICQKYTEIDSRVKVCSKPNGGVSSARNKGIDIANGDYICFVDSDDYIDENYCDIMISHLDNETKMVVSGLRRSNQSKNEYIKHRLPKGSYDYNEIKKIIIDDGTLSGFTFHSSCAILFDLKIIKEQNIRFNEKIKFNEDGLFNTQYFLSFNQGKIYVDYTEATYIYRINDSSSTHNIDIKRHKSDMKLIENILLEYRDDILNEQLLYRRATVALALILIHKSNRTLTYNNLKKIMHNEKNKSGFNNIEFNKLNVKKKLLYFLIRIKFYRALLFFIKIS